MKRLMAQVDEKGRLILPPELATRFALKPGDRIHIDEGQNGLSLRRPAGHLAKVYIEPTNRCDLACRTCMRNVWAEPLGRMNASTFGRIIDGLREFSPPPTVIFGGFGEPLNHPDILEMVSEVKALDAPVELITNGTLLTPEISRGFIEAGLDLLWISLDGATPATYADVRLGAALPDVLANLAEFKNMRIIYNILRPQLGIVFVAMKRNIADLPRVMLLGNQLGATRFLVSNVLPYTAEMSKEVLFSRVQTLYRPPSIFRLDLPKVDVNDLTRDPLYSVMRIGHDVILSGADMDRANDRCPFIESGSAAVSWEGNLSPCLPLMHEHVSYVDAWERVSRRYVVGNICDQSLLELWSTPEYAAFRERVKEFDFPLCTICGGCQLSETNEEDCYGNAFPTCGGCLWAQGVIQCP